MGETTAVAHGGNPQDRAASPRPRCIAAIPRISLVLVQLTSLVLVSLSVHRIV
ncbi:hypothetical protein BJP36_42905 [Moorena producens JHB]|uniref:Uncharacterized protein n=1 Tax=Moorena producens (strain JHB) TaxID=1454205 RepID=A0A9Q9ST04_MOOP1|nr:hypothetical protein [Moorena producens]WAN69115.1 hypothetical protein BJP36_42905 [Moorena producens JHB]